MLALESSLWASEAEGTYVRAIVLINPNNPTGALLSEKDIHNVLGFAAKHNLVIIADEVYQTNVYIGQFLSFKRGLRDLQAKDPGIYGNVKLVSLNSVSKGMLGEGGHRGGYFELVGFNTDAVAKIHQFASITVCPSVIGQCLVELMVNPPTVGSPSYALYKKEYNSIFENLTCRATAFAEALRQMKGVQCQDPKGGMFLFPRILLSHAAMEAAEKEGVEPDEFYASRMLDATGVCVVPGSAYGQKEGTWHFSATILAPGTEWIHRIATFHKLFMEETGG
jgi:alanine transaminase